ncbi:MAG: hypothetical protein H3C30_04750 [Candidatus Hydrogenedentes bacterium]|nr:hypothetical protein [Candidatus Hydrogenedentota bacterium]
MSTDTQQRNIFNFLLNHLETKEQFNKQDLKSVTTWCDETFNTYWLKQFKPFVINVKNDLYRVSEAFRPYSTWEKFQQHVTQVRRLASSDYMLQSYEKVRVYEFFMPLANEGHLRTALDALFYRDLVLARLKTIPQDELHKNIPLRKNETSDNYMERLCDWISNHFAGYSIYHVNGRFRACSLVSKEKATQKQRYIIDETTAVTRFIFPCVTDDEAEQTGFLFEHLFVKAIIEVVNGEDEIWMVETGMHNRLHVWRVNQNT